LNVWLHRRVGNLTKVGCMRKYGRGQTRGGGRLRKRRGRKGRNDLYRGRSGEADDKKKEGEGPESWVT